MENPTFFYSTAAKTGQALPEKHFEATTQEIETALSAAEAATLPFAQSSARERANFLGQIALQIEGRREAILERYQQESGLPQGRAQGELQRTLSQIQHFKQLLEAGHYVQASIHKTAEGPDLRKMLYPLGPIVVFGASNFPLAFSTAGGDTISALAAGCPVVVKAHPYHTGTSSLVAEAITEAVALSPFPNGVFAHLQSATHALGQQLAMDHRIKGVGFTGSLAGGKALCALAQEREAPIPVFAEMGSTNPIVILPEKMKKEAQTLAQALADSVLLGNGQFCTNPGLVYAFGKLPDSFSATLEEVFTKSPTGTMVHPNIAEAYQKKLQAIQEKFPAIKLLQKAPFAPALGQVSADYFQAHPELGDEVFGPFTLVVVHDNVQALAQSIQQLDGQLTATILATVDDLAAYPQIHPLLVQKVGRLLFDGVPTGVAVTTAMQHGGPYPASSDSRFTAVGSDAIYRWLRPVCYQDAPQAVLPEALKDHNPLELERNINNQWTKETL